MQACHRGQRLAVLGILSILAIWSLRPCTARDDNDTMDIEERKLFAVYLPSVAFMENVVPKKLLDIIHYTFQEVINEAQERELGIAAQHRRRREALAGRIPQHMLDKLPSPELKGYHMKAIFTLFPDTEN